MVAKPYSQKGYGTIIGTHLLGIAAAHPEVFQARLCYGTYSPGNTCGASLAKDCGLELVQGGDALKSKFAGVKKVFASINLDT
jgi:hypothetical protein